MHSSPPTRAPRSQLAIEQPLTGGHWNPPEKDIPHPETKKKPQEDCRRSVTVIKSDQILEPKSHTHQVGDPQTREQ